ncbi:ankyrin repeat domain-containing protein [Legionella parisiensis]|uniref:ankyrin repeat domain-containing protein n=1 Tax=Legionella parisiensis TaxID=45071 RepID=UPI001056D4DA|nr:ankyrin repeat domain-containing protein [Legionella parisiensis]
MNDETFKIPRGQEWLIGRMQSLGYKGNPGGMCFGLCEMARQAVQLGLKEYSLFQERLKQIALIPIENFPEEMERIKAQRLALFQKAKQQAKEELEDRNEGVAIDKHMINDLANDKFISLMADLPVEDRARLSIDMFLDGVELYFHPSDYPMLFHSQMKHQISNAAAILVEPNQLQQKKLQGELPAPLIFSGSYGTEDLYSYLAILQKQLKDCKNPIPLRLNSENHALCLIFDPSEDETNCWTLFDPNKMDNMDEPGGEESGDYIERGFCGEEQKPKIEFATWIHFPSNEDRLRFQENATAENAEWSNMHSLTDFNSNWLNIALYNGDIEAIKNFLDIGFNILEKNNRGLDYLDLAIVYDHPDIVQLFLQKIPKTELHSGYLIKAIDCGNLEMTKMLLEAGLDPMEIDKSISKSPLDFSAQKSHLPDNKNTIHQEIYKAVQTKAESFHKKENTLKQRQKELTISPSERVEDRVKPKPLHKIDKAYVNVMSIAAPTREDNIRRVLRLLDSDLMKNQERATPDIIREIREKIGKINPKETLSVITILNEIRGAIASMDEKEEEKNDVVVSVLDVFANKQNSTFQIIRDELEAIPELKMDNRNNLP